MGLVGVFWWLFVPDGYPESVAAEYAPYQLWDTIQQVTFFVTTVAGSQAVFKFHGVGQETRTAAGATCMNISRDLSGHLLSIAFTNPRLVNRYKLHVPTFRLAAEVLSAIGLYMEISAAYFPWPLLIFGGPMVRAVAGGMGGAVRSVILQHFAKAGNNSDVVLKETNQDKGGKVFGLVVGAMLLTFIGIRGDEQEQREALLKSFAVCSVLTVIHIAGNVAAVRTLQVPPATCVLQCLQSQKFMLIKEDGSCELAAGADRENASVLRLRKGDRGCPPNGMMLQTAEHGLYIDRNRNSSTSAPPGELQLEPIEWVDKDCLVVLDGAKYRALSQVPAASKQGGGIAEWILPPGWPYTLPPGYTEYIGWRAVCDVTGYPIWVIRSLLFWGHVYGVGDSDKSPADAAFIDLSIAAIDSCVGLIAGIPWLASGYSFNWFLREACISVVGELFLFAAAVVPRRYFYMCVMFSISLKAWGGVISRVINAQVDQMFSRHHEVDLIHLNVTQRNRSILLDLFTALLCVYYALHLSDAGPEADPGLPCMITLTLLLHGVQIYGKMGCAKALDKARRSDFVASLSAVDREAPPRGGASAGGGYQYAPLREQTEGQELDERTGGTR